MRTLGWLVTLWCLAFWIIAYCMSAATHGVLGILFILSGPVLVPLMFVLANMGVR